MRILLCTNEIDSAQKRAWVPVQPTLEIDEPVIHPVRTVKHDSLQLHVYVEEDRQVKAAVPTAPS